MLQMTILLSSGENIFLFAECFARNTTVLSLICPAAESGISDLERTTLYWMPCYSAVGYMYLFFKCAVKFRVKR